MNITSGLNRLTDSLVRATCYVPGEKGSRPSFPTIALSREAGAQGTAVANELGRRLRWPVYDHELLERMAEKMQVNVNLLESIDERGSSWLREAVQSFLLNRSVSEQAYFLRLVETLLAEGAEGRGIIVGRGAVFVLPPATTLRVRLVANLDDRIARICGEMHLSAAEARRHIRDTDRERAGFIREHFHADVTDPLDYDLLLNTSRFSVPVCAEIIEASLTHWASPRPEQSQSGERAPAGPTD